MRYLMTKHMNMAELVVLAEESGKELARLFYCRDWKKIPGAVRSKRHAANAKASCGFKKHRSGGQSTRH